MIINHIKIVSGETVIEDGYLEILDKKIHKIGKSPYQGKEGCLDGKGLIAMPGFIDIHIHGSAGIDFMDASEEEVETVANSLYQEGVTTFMATTLTSDFESLKRVCETIKKVKDRIPSLGGIHFEGPYISEKYKGAQNEAFIRNPDIKEFEKLQEASGGNVRYITLAPEKEGALDFISAVTKEGVVVSAGHTNATFADVEKAIQCGLSNTTHTHNAMSPHHHRNPGVVTAAMYFDSLYTELICDKIHVCPETMKTFYKIVGQDRFIMITNALKAKHSDLENFQLFGLDCVRKNGAAYLTTGPLAGSLLSMDQGLRNMKEVADLSLVELAKISSTNAAKALHFHDRGLLKEGYLADVVLLDEKLYVKKVFKEGKEVYSHD